MTTATPEIALGISPDPYLVPTTPETPTPVPEIVAALRTIQEKYFANSDILTAAEWARRPLLRKVAQNTARLADSLL